MVRQRKSTLTPGKTKEIANLCPAADKDDEASPNEGETSTSNNNNRLRNKKGKAARSPEVTGSATEGVGQKVELHHVATRSSTRQVRNAKRDKSPTTPVTKGKNAKSSNTPETGKNILPKSRRPWELWTANDKKLFFEGLFQYGKDFDAIQDFIQKKAGKKAKPHLIKNKDQVRYFYYRTWNKIQKFVDIDDNVEKSTQELYGLINFGELRKRVGPGLKLDQKTGLKFRELVHNGLTTIKFRGKNYRLRTPVCRALKVLNKVGEGEKEQRLNLPNTLTLELKPKNNEAWSYVQTCSHNPHVRVAIKPSRQLSTVFSYLDKKWKTADEKLRDKLNLVVKAEKELRISVAKDSKVYPVSFKTAEAQPRLGVALENYKENFKGLTDSPTQKSTADTKSNDTTATKPDSPEITVEDEEDGDDMLLSVLKEKQTLSKVVPDESSNIDSTKSSPRTLKDAEPVLNKERAFEGWTAKTVKTLTVGEVYLMLGSPQRLVLEYEWTDIEADKFHLLTLNNMLRRLVHLASSQLMDVSKGKTTNSPARCAVCKCGKAGTPSTTKSPGASRSPAVAKDPSTPRGRRAPVSSPAANNSKPTKEDGLFVAPKVPPSPKPGETVKPLDATHFLQQLDSLKPQKHKMRNRMNRRPFLVQRRLLPKAQTVAVAMIPNAPVNAIHPTFVPVVPGQPLPSRSVAGLTRTVISPVTVAPPNIIPTSLVTHGNDLANIISAAACQSGIRVAQTPPKFVGGPTSLAMSSTFTSPTSTTMSGPPAKKARRITPIPVIEDANYSPLSNPTSPFASIAAQQMSSPLAAAPLIHSSPNQRPLVEDMQVSDVLHQLANAVNPDLTPSAIKPSPIEPPSITSFLDISLPATDLSVSSERLIDGFCGLLESSGLVKSSTGPTPTTSSINPTTPPSSPNRSKVSSPGPLVSWFNSDDFSLSGFLLDSPQKKAGDLPTTSTNNPIHFELSRDVDTTFQNMLNESSVDLVSKFADIAAQMNSSKD